jgi:hypothetical protein
MLADLRINQFAQMRLEALVCAFLVGAHQAGIAHHIGGEDRGETAGDGRGGHCSGGNNSPAEFNLLRAGKRQFHATGRSGFARNRRVFETHHNKRYMSVTPNALKRDLASTGRLSADVWDRSTR